SRFVKRKRCWPKRPGGSPASGVPHTRYGRNLTPLPPLRDCGEGERGGEVQPRKREEPQSWRPAPEPQSPLGLRVGAVLSARPREDRGKERRRRGGAAPCTLVHTATEPQRAITG